jgi:hypothetical protein
VCLTSGDIALVASASVKYDGSVACHDTLIPGARKPITFLVDENAFAVFFAGDE